MPLPLLGFLPKIIKTAAGILGVDSVKDVVDAIQNNKLTPEQRVALEQASMEYDSAVLDSMKEQALAMLSSDDRYTRRARPTVLYAATGITVALCLLVGIATVNGTHIDMGAIGAIVSLMTPLWTAGGVYIYRRSTEKLNGSGTE